MSVCLQRTTTVWGSGASMPSISLYLRSRTKASSASCPIIAVNTTSSAVTGWPSCHFDPARIFQVISIRPSGATFQRLLSIVGTVSASWASKGCVRPFVVNPALVSFSTSDVPWVAVPVPPTESMPLTVNRLPFTAATTRFFAAGCAGALFGAGAVLVAWGAGAHDASTIAAPTMTKPRGFRPMPRPLFEPIRRRRAAENMDASIARLPRGPSSALSPSA